MIEQFTGKVTKDSNILYEKVEGHFEIIEDSFGLKSWSGVFQILSGEAPDLYEGNLEFENGGHGEIFITKHGFDSTTVEFTGAGAIYDYPGI